MGFLCVSLKERSQGEVDNIAIGKIEEDDNSRALTAGHSRRLTSGGKADYLPPHDF